MRGRSTYVLIHGEWSGGWIWQRVAAAIQRAGHPVFTPTLTGLGERYLLATPSTGLQTHIEDVRVLLEQEDLQNVVLTGHGYAGMIVSAVAERVPDRLCHLIYLDAFLPHDGESMTDLAGTAAKPFLERESNTDGEDWRVAPPDPGLLGIDEEPDRGWIASQLTAHPLNCFRDPVRLDTSDAAGIPRSFVYCNDPPFPGMERLASRARHENCRFQILATGHFPHVTSPSQVSDLLLELERRGFTTGFNP
jgi:pimeloyl-ACP methyl ester carboxylesterase